MTSTPTEAKKYDTEKVRLDLIPPEAVIALGTILSMGAKKYGDRNWQQGLKMTRVGAAMLRHWFASLMGEKNDPESGYPHTWHILTNAAFLVWTEKHKPDCDDR